MATVLLIVTLVVTVLAAIGGAVYMSGTADDLITFVAEKYFVYKAKAEVTALQHAGSDAASDFLKGEFPSVFYGYKITCPRHGTD